MVMMLVFAAIVMFEAVGPVTMKNDHTALVFVAEESLQATLQLWDPPINPVTV